MMKPAQFTCAHCGRPIVAPPFLRDDGRYCCESCFLDRLEPGDGRTSQALLAEALAAALDLREHETGLHSKRVACHTLVLARRQSTEVAFLQQIYWGALLHDIGKIGVSDAVLLKQGALTEDEWREMRTHPAKGYEILAPVPGMAEAARIVRAHEERYDGSGYPLGLRGEAIPLGARLLRSSTPWTPSPPTAPTGGRRASMQRRRRSSAPPGPSSIPARWRCSWPRRRRCAGWLKPNAPRWNMRSAPAPGRRPVLAEGKGATSCGTERLSRRLGMDGERRDRHGTDLDRGDRGAGALAARPVAGPRPRTG